MGSGCQNENIEAGQIVSQEQSDRLAPNTGAQPDAAVYQLGTTYLYLCHTVPLPLHARAPLSLGGSLAARSAQG